MKVHVTGRDILLGSSNDFHCPIARAICRAKHVKLGSFTVDGAGATCVATGTVFNLPNKVWSFINDFDEMKPVRPLTFELITAKS